jgi:antitoxin Phd
MSNGRLLIVDDNPLVLASYADSLAAAGFETAKASSGADALGQIERDEFDAVFSDVAMPAMNGFVLLRRLRARSPKLPVVLMLDAPNKRAAVQGMELGAVQSLVKPIGAELLAETAAYAIRLRRLKRNVPPTLPVNRNRRVGAASVSATAAKNGFAGILEKAIQGSTIVITKHDTPKAVLISIDEFDSLSRANRTRLDRLSGEFDALLARMQTPAAQSRMKAAFEASPRQLGKAAVAASRRRG